MVESNNTLGDNRQTRSQEPFLDQIERRLPYRERDSKMPTVFRIFVTASNFLKWVKTRSKLVAAQARYSSWIVVSERVCFEKLSSFVRMTSYQRYQGRVTSSDSDSS